MGKISITVEVTADNKELVEKLLEDVEEEKSVISASKIRKGKKTKDVDEDEDDEQDDEETDEDEEDAQDEADDEDDSDDEEETDDDEDDSEDEEAPVKGGVTGKDLNQLKVALKVYSGKHGKVKAVALLHKFGKTSDAVKKKDLPKLLKLLKV